VKSYQCTKSIKIRIHRIISITNKLPMIWNNRFVKSMFMYIWKFLNVSYDDYWFSLIRIYERNRLKSSHINFSTFFILLRWKNQFSKWVNIISYFVEREENNILLFHLVYYVKVDSIYFINMSSLSVVLFMEKISIKINWYFTNFINIFHQNIIYIMLPSK
jgi:hypothetical protein